MPHMSKIARVALFAGIDKILSYLVPKNLECEIRAGSLVRVPLRGTSATAAVMGVEDADVAAAPFKMRAIWGVVQDEPALTEELIALAKWMTQYYACGLQSVFEAMIPSVVRSGKSSLEALEVRLKRGFDDDDLAKIAKRAPQQAKILEFLKGCGGSVLKAALLKVTQASAQSVDALAKKGFLAQQTRTIQRSAFDDPLGASEETVCEHTLNGEQTAALNDILSDISSRQFRPRLLYGVTGSGKTEVYIRAMRQVLKDGGSCIFLVPEIALTPQTVGRLRGKLKGYAKNLVVWHSNLTDGQRYDAWKTLAKGESNVVVGARSCVFAPLENIRLIIVDEEHDTAYKQDKTPRYNARDVAVMRAHLNSCTCILGSATPSLETLYNVRNSKYAVSHIKSRIDGRKLPRVYIADMRHERPGAELSAILRGKISERLERGEQTILFLNRRGYSKLFQCPDCGEVMTCPHCSVSMTWHKREDIVKCHLCGYTAPAPQKCPKCGSPKAKWKGYGTQKLEDVIARNFPNARIGRMDRDAMKKRDNYRKILGDFRAGRLDILIGTQMIAKGLDFPRVTLVGIVNADISLHMPDFRAAEKTYQLIVQVAGRAGRGDGEGEVVIQTLSPEAAPIQYAKRDDMQSFLEEELAARLEYSYPPTTKLIRQIFRSRNEQKLEAFSEAWAKTAEETMSNLCQIRGPAPAPVEKSEDFYRYHIWYFCKSVVKTVAALNEVAKNFNTDEDIEYTIDVDPLSLM